MVSTRRAPLPPPPPAPPPHSQDPPVPKEARKAVRNADEKSSETREPSSPLSPSRKRQANEELPEARPKKRQQLDTERAEAEFDSKDSVQGAVKPEISEVDGDRSTSGPRSELEETAGELLKLYAYTKSFEYLSAILSRPNTRKGRLYKLLYEKFQRQRRDFPTKDNFVVAASLGSADIQDQRFARCINFVTFAASMLGSRDASFSQLNDHFFEVFIDRTGQRSGHLVKLQADILLGLKTQAYIAQAAEKGKLQEGLLNELFPSDMTARLAAIQPESSSAKLVQSEQTFVKQLNMRKRHLMRKDTPELNTALKDEYKWNDVLKNMIDYLRSHFEEIARKSSEHFRSMNDDGENEDDVRGGVYPKVTPPARTEHLSGTLSQLLETGSGLSATSTQSPTASLTRVSEASKIAAQTTAQISGNPAISKGTPLSSFTPETAPPATPSAVSTSAVATADSAPDMSDDIFAKALQAANKAMEQTSATDNPYSSPKSAINGSRPSSYVSTQNVSYSNNTHMPQQFTNPLTSLSQQASQNRMPHFSPPGAQRSSMATGPVQASGPSPHGSNLAPNGQSHPTHQLYEMAREATTGRPSQQQPARRPGSQSQRRPWTQEEEKALLDGLDQVKGPHWSMILQLYGPGGKISEVLKDRNQVQLKDKARNLKLWFLKSGGEVPINLRSVTGELKTRAPAAIRNAAAAAAAAQAQSNGLPGTPGSAGHTPQHQPHHAPFDPSHSPYAPASPYAPTAPPANTASGINPQMPTAGPQHAHGIGQNTGIPLGDPTVGLESWGNDAADAAAAQVIKDLTAEFDFDPASFADAEPDKPKEQDAATDKDTKETEAQPADAVKTTTDEVPALTAISQEETTPAAIAATEGKPDQSSKSVAAILSSADASTTQSVIEADKDLNTVDVSMERADATKDAVPLEGNDDENDIFAAAAAAAATAAAEMEVAINGADAMNTTTTTAV